MPKFQWLRPHLSTWSKWAAAVAGLGLLLALERVVAQSVVQGEQRRAASAAQALGMWRCNLLTPGLERGHCLQRLSSAAAP